MSHGFVITEEENLKIIRALARAGKNAAKAMGYDGTKSAIRHLADDLPANYEPPVPISSRTGI